MKHILARLYLPHTRASNYNDSFPQKY